MPDLLASKLRELDISNITLMVLGGIALVFVGSFDVVPLRTGEWIKLPKKD